MTVTTEEPIVVPEKAMSAAAKTMAPGFYPGMSREDYDLSPGISHTMLKALDYGKKATMTRGMLVGTMLHHLCQDKKLAASLYFTVDEDMDLRAQESKKKMEEARKLTGKTPILPRERNLVAAMYKALMNDKYGKAFIENKGEREVAMFASISGESNSRTFGEHHTLCKGIIDLDATSIWDLKTCHYTTESEFMNNVVGQFYDSQAAMYRELYFHITHTFKPFKWLCVSKQEPHNVFVVECTPYMLASGLRWVNTMLNRYEGTINKEQQNEDERSDRQD